jgi:1,4-dihydroxy-2-naphthoyl-CoA synthase
MVSAIFDARHWEAVPGFDFQDVTYHRAREHGTVRIAIDRPEVRNAFRPQTVDELATALDHARQTTDVGCVLLTGTAPRRRTAGGRSARAATSGSAARTATSTRTERRALAASTSWRCSG